MRVNVYVDGFNLYYGIRYYDRNAQNYRWLDLLKLSQRLLPSHQIGRVRYFRAQVDGRGDPGSPLRQQIYWRALQTLPNLTIHKGQFLSNSIRMPLANPPQNGPRTVEVWKTEEKGSDVNIATYLLLDCFRQDYDMAVVISNDSDLIEPIMAVRKEFGCSVGVFNPQQGFSNALKRAATFYTKIQEQHLASSQFPPSIQVGNSTITRPREWT